MRIPEIRERLQLLAILHGIPELEVLADELKRRSSGKRPPRVAQPMTPQLAQTIRQYAALNPDVPQYEMARVFNVNPGRVSEALRGTCQ
ncbi:MAG: hypothetical protein ACK4FJ_18710 [Ferrovibrio sp.]|uniref:hypothetical protein n=1 Tax=Ferrovibrio sp. TaxID=1917215 RepID=UPI00391BA883